MTGMQYSMVRMAAVPAGADRLGQSVVTNFHVAVLVKNVTGLKVTMNDAALMQEGQTLGDLTQEESCLLRSKAAGRLREQLP